MKLNNNQAGELATRLAICPQAIEEAIRRGLLSFVKHRNSRCWRFGDARNGSFRRIDGDPFRINGDCVKAAAATRGESWHRLIGLGDVQANDRRDILLTLEGSKDALAALHFADAEGTLPHVGIVASLGAGINPPADDLEKLRGHRVRIIADVDKSGVQAAARIAECLTCVAAEVQIFSLAGLKRDDGLPVKDLFDLSRIDYDNFEANRDLWSITDLNSKGSRVQVITEKQKFFPLPLPPPHESPESHGFPVYPVSNAQELERELQELADRNACIARNTARRQRWQLLRDLKAVEKGISRKLVADELIHAFNRWYTVSAPHLDPKKTRDDYCGLFLAELGKVRVPTGEGEALKMSAVIEPVTNEFDVHLNIIRGQVSETFVWNIAEEWKEIEKPIYAYYLGDHDPSGLKIEASLKSKLSHFVEKDFEWERLAITAEDFAGDLLGFTVKRSGSWRDYLAQFGDRCVEVDALPPGEIRDRVRQTIQHHIDYNEWGRLQETERLERETLESTLRNLDEEDDQAASAISENGENDDDLPIPF